ncbi:hypothetical protein DB346_03375 [Verrucomicrobia bacterium LW23]|nr:hypothetical protein DB346_03375 [Verrucomicrobia bacterium LW23]
MQELAPDLWIKHFPLRLLGGEQGRVVTVIRLTSGRAAGRLIIHSTAPFGAGDVAEITALGTPGWLVDATLMHDTYAQAGRRAFADIPYLAPAGFAARAGVATQPLLPVPAEWGDEVRVLRLAGMPALQEHAFFHVPSRTLIVTDLIFNFEETTGWARFVHRWLMGVQHQPDMGRLFPLMIRDRKAFNESITELMRWDFNRIIVGHHKPIETDGRRLLREAMARKGLLRRD